MDGVDEKLLAKALQGVVKTGKYTLGLKEATKSLRSVKLLIYSNSLDAETAAEIEASCRSASVPILAYPGSSIALGRLCGRPFRVSVVSVRSAGGADLTPLIKK